jgi:hypothetical protein
MQSLKEIKSEDSCEKEVFPRISSSQNKLDQVAKLENNYTVEGLLKEPFKTNLTLCYAGTSHEDIREGYAIGEVCRRLQAMQAITW